jgi:hypothetical protein
MIVISIVIEDKKDEDEPSRSVAGIGINWGLYAREY